MQFNQKRARTSSKRAKLWIFTPHSSKFRAFGTLHPPKRHVFLEFLEENKANHFSKRALRAATARNKRLKKALTMSGPRQRFQDPVKHLTAGLHYERFLWEILFKELFQATLITYNTYQNSFKDFHEWPDANLLALRISSRNKQFGYLSQSMEIQY